MLPTLVLSALLSLAAPGGLEPRIQSADPVLSLEVAAIDSPVVSEDDGFTSDRSGFPERKAATSDASSSPITLAFGFARTFLGVWLVASALFGIIWGLLGWATGGRRVAARA